MCWQIYSPGLSASFIHGSASSPGQRKAHASCTVAHAAHTRAVPRRAMTWCLSHWYHRGLEIITWWPLLKHSMVSSSSCTTGIHQPYNHPHSWHHFCLPFEAGPVEATAPGGGSGNACDAFWFAASLEIVESVWAEQLLCTSKPGMSKPHVPTLEIMWMDSFSQAPASPREQDLPWHSIFVEG